jgi:hypothetical protein
MWEPSTIFLILVVIIGLFSAGCVHSSGNSPVNPAVPLITPAQQIVNGTVLATPTPTPTTALPTETDSGYDKLMEKNTTPANTVSLEDPTGSLFIHIRAGGSVKGVKVFIARDGTNVPPIDYSYLPDGTVVEGQNIGYLQVIVLPDGKSELVRLSSGSFTAYLPNMNVGQPPEEQSFMIGKNDITHIWFEGFSASSGGCNCGG